MLDELDRLNLTSSTMVVLHSDHGYSLGEHGEWQKFSNFEHGTRVPLIIRVPWLPQAAGVRTSAQAELVDIFPTLNDALDVRYDPAREGGTLDGESLMPVLKDPTFGGKNYSISQYPRCPVDRAVPWKSNVCEFVDRSLIPFMGYTIRTADWRFTQWLEWNGALLRPDWDKPVANELYSHKDDDGYDFNKFENVNQNETYPEVVTELRQILRQVVGNFTRLY